MVNTPELVLIISKHFLPKNELQDFTRSRRMRILLEAQDKSLHIMEKYSCVGEYYGQ